MRKDLDPELRDKQPLQLPSMLDCPECDTPFDVIFICPDGIFDTEDLVEAPEMDVECPSCKHVWHQAYEGWTINDEA